MPEKVMVKRDDCWRIHTLALKIVSEAMEERRGALSRAERQQLLIKEFSQPKYSRNTYLQKYWPLIHRNPSWFRQVLHKAKDKIKDADKKGRMRTVAFANGVRKFVDSIERFDNMLSPASARSAGSNASPSKRRKIEPIPAPIASAPTPSAPLSISRVPREGSYFVSRPVPSSAPGPFWPTPPPFPVALHSSSRPPALRLPRRPAISPERRPSTSSSMSASRPFLTTSTTLSGTRDAVKHISPVPRTSTSISVSTIRSRVLTSSASPIASPPAPNLSVSGTCPSHDRLESWVASSTPQSPFSSFVLLDGEEEPLSAIEDSYHLGISPLADPSGEGVLSWPGGEELFYAARDPWQIFRPETEFRIGIPTPPASEGDGPPWSRTPSSDGVKADPDAAEHSV